MYGSAHCRRCRKARPNTLGQAVVSPVPFVVAKGQADRKQRALCSLSDRQEKSIGSCLRQGPTTVWRCSRYAGFPALCVGYEGKVQGMGVCLGGVCEGKE